MYKEEVELEIRMDGRNAIITGGSLGLGKAIATEFTRSGANVALVARRQETPTSAASMMRFMALLELLCYSHDKPYNACHNGKLR